MAKRKWHKDDVSEEVESAPEAQEPISETKVEEILHDVKDKIVDTFKGHKGSKSKSKSGIESHPKFDKFKKGI